jgi:hypothetical protein
MSPTSKPTMDPTEVALSAIQEALEVSAFDEPVAAKTSAYIDADYKRSSFEQSFGRPVESPLDKETVKAIQALADSILSEEEWVQIDGYVAAR